MKQRVTIMGLFDGKRAEFYINCRRMVTLSNLTQVVNSITIYASSKVEKGESREQSLITVVHLKHL